MDQLKYWTKNSIAHLLFYTGVLFLLKWIRLRKRAVILMYHRVLKEDERRGSFSHPGIIVDPETFSRQLDCLHKYFRVLTQTEFLQHLEERNFPSSSVLLTFDDGWLDNYTNAFPILKEKELPAIIFLATGFIGNEKLFWQERLAACLFGCFLDRGEKARKILGRCGLENIGTLSDEEAKKAIRTFVSFQKEQDQDTLRSLVEEITESSSASRESHGIDKFLDWKQVREMSGHSLFFGCHSVHHHILTHIPPEVAVREIRESKKAIEDNCLTSPHLFCYPNGNHNDRIKEEVARAGFRAAMSTIPGYIDPSTDHYGLRRINIHQHISNSTPLFMARILGLF